jgi:hypothetical protein
VERGELILDELRNTGPGDLLHEAGHLAVLPAHLRHTANGSLHNEVAVAHAGEPEATAWAYAALTFTFGLGVYPGAAGLLAAGMIALPQKAEAGLAPPYPHMLRWLRA